MIYSLYVSYMSIKSKTKKKRIKNFQAFSKAFQILLLSYIYLY